MRLLPRSLFGRLMLVLASGLIIAQLLSTAINLQERDSLLVRASGMQPAQRIADIVKLLDSLSPPERNRIVGIFNAPPLVVSLEHSPATDDSETTGGPHAAMFAAVLRAALGDERPIRVTMRGTPPTWTPPTAGDGRPVPHGGTDGPGRHASLCSRRDLVHDAGSPGGWNLGHLRHADHAGIGQPSVETAGDAGDSARGRARRVLRRRALGHAPAARARLAPPTNSVATSIGRRCRKAALSRSARAAHAFNTMQARLIHFIEERIRILTAMSHDLKTPITRMRLRAELLEDENLREKFESDLLEMQAMVTQALDFMRGLSTGEPEQPVDVMALLETLKSDNEAMGRSVTLDGRATKPFRGVPQLLKRCIANLIDNAVLYGKQADIHVEESATELILRIRDHGPGMPDAAVGERVRTVLSTRGLTQPRNRRNRTGLEHCAQHRAGARRGRPAAQSRARRAGGDPDAAVQPAPGHFCPGRYRNPLIFCCYQRTAGRMSEPQTPLAPQTCPASRRACTRRSSR